MQTLVSLFNQALTAVGQGMLVVDPDEQTREAALCRLWVDPSRRAVLSAFHWPSARQVVRLAPSAIRTDSDWMAGDPFPGYHAAFQLPVGCVRPVRLHDFSRFELGLHGGERALFTNSEAPILHFTADVENPDVWEPALYQSVVFALAANINMARSGKPNVTQLFENKVQQLLQMSATDAANSDDVYFEALPSLWNGTGFSVPESLDRYFYPTGTFAIGGIA